MPGSGVTRIGCWRRRGGFALVVIGVALMALFVVSARWWVGYGTATWIADVGDGTLYIVEVDPSGRTLVGWCGGDNVSLANGKERKWMWTWWMWGKRKNKWEPGYAYTVWPLGPLVTCVGGVLLWPGYREARRAGRNQCVACGYSLAGLDAKAPCPECGHVRVILKTT